MWIGGVRVVILDDDNNMLMVRQHHEDRDIWMVPGGGIEDGENSKEAAKREVLEETGLDVEIGRLIWHIEEVSEQRGQRFVDFFFGRLKGGMLQLGRDPEFDDENQVLREVRFMSKEELVNTDTDVYPEYLRDEIWSIIEGDCMGYDAFKLRTHR